MRPYQNIHLFELVFLAIWTSCQWNIVGCVLPAVFRKADYRMKGDDERRITQQNPPHLLSGRPLSEKDWEIVPRIQMAGAIFYSTDRTSRFSGIEFSRMPNFRYLTFFRSSHCVSQESSRAKVPLIYVFRNLKGIDQSISP